MTFISIVLCLVLERWQSLWNKCRRHQWLLQYAGFIQRHFKIAAIIGSWPGLVVMLLPLLMLVGIIQSVLHHILGGYLGWVFNTIVLLYCLNSSSLYHIARETWFKDTDVARATEPLPALVTNAGNRLMLFNCDIFAVIFWFCLFGAFGALFYRLIAVWRANAVISNSELSSYGSLLTAVNAVFDWLSVRFLSLGMALTGNFLPCYAVLKQRILDAPSANEVLLQECAAAALHHNTVTDNDYLELGLRSLIVWLVLLAIVTLTAVVHYL